MSGVAVLMLVVAVAPFTNVGSQLILSGIAVFLPVEVEHVDGSLFGDLQLSRVSVETDVFTLQVRDVKVALELTCLWERRLCLRNLTAAAVEVVWDGGLWRSANVQASVSLNDSQIEIGSLLTLDALLELREPSKPRSNSQEGSVSLPVDLVVRNAQLERASWNIYGVRYAHQSIEFSGQWVENLLVLEQVRVLDKGLGLLEAGGEVSLSPGWPFEINATVSWNGDKALVNTLEEFFSTEQIQTLPQALSEVQLLSPWKLVAGGTLKEQSFSLDAALSGLGYEALEISLSGGHRAAQPQLVLDSFELRDSNTDSALSGSAELALGKNNYWKLAIHSSNFSLPAVNDTFAGQLAGTLDASGSFAPNKWSLALNDIDLRGAINDLPGQIVGRAKINQDLLLSDSHLQAQLNGASLSLISRQAKAGGVDLDLSVADIGQWSPDSSGSVELTAVLNKALSSVKLRGHVRGFQWQDIAFEHGSLQGFVDLNERHRFKLNTEFSELALNTVQLASLSLRASGHDGKQSLQLDSTGDVAISLSGQGDFEVGDSGSGRLSLEGHLASVGALLAEGYELDGELKLEARAAWSESAISHFSGELQLIHPQLRQEVGGLQAAKLAWDNVNLNFDKNDSGLKLTAVGIKGGEKLLSMGMMLPGERGGALAGSLMVHQLDIQPFRAFIPELSQLEGVVNGEVALSGTVDNLQAQGSLALEGGHFSLLENPTEVESLRLHLLMQGDNAIVDGELGLGGGTLDITGTLGFLPQPYVELQLIGRQETLLFPPSTQLQVSHNIKLRATADFLNISGDLTVHQGVLEHEQLPEGGVALSEDVIVVGYTGPRPAPFDLGLDVQVKIEDHFKVVGSVVDVTVGGDLQLLQERGRPLQLFGNLNVVGGELRAYRQSLQVKRGTVAFSGAPENPALDMRAERIISTENITVGLALRGTLEDPVLDVYSDPEMPRTETLSYLVRGRGLDVGAGVDGAALALSMGASLVNEAGLLQKFDKVPGLNSVALSAEGSENDTTATVSGYIGNRIYLSYGVGLYEPINVLTARLYLKSRLWIEVVSSLENSLDLYYSFDIE